MRLLDRQSPHTGWFAMPGKPPRSPNVGVTLLPNTPSPALVPSPSELACTATVFLLLCFLISGCRLRKNAPEASIEFTRIPQAAAGGPDTLDIIEGRVAGVRPQQQIVLYARR